MEVRAAFAFILALFLTMVLIPPLVRLAGPLRLMDTGGGRKVHAGRVPRIGGVAIFVGFLVPVVIWVPPRPDLVAFIVAAVVIFVFGVLDDRFNLDYRLKLLGQILATAIVIAVGGVVIRQVPFWPGGLLPDFLALPITVLAVVAVTNAVNLSDGLDGLAGGISLLAAAGLILLATGGDDRILLVVLAALIGAIFGFLRFNTFPARLFMGDTGSQLLGFSLAVLAVSITQRADTGFSPLLPLLVFGLPLLDMLTVMVGRIARGHSPFKADRTHLHHRLLDSGLSQYEAVSLVYATQFGFVALAYVLRFAGDVAILLSYALCCALVLFAVRALERRQEQRTNRQPQRSQPARLGAWARRMRLFTRLPLQFLTWTIPLFLVLGAFAVGPVSPDIGLLAAALFGVLTAVLLLVPRLPFFALERLSAYTTAVAVVYLLEYSSTWLDACPHCLPLFYGALALTAGAWVRFTSTNFGVSALDVLILLGALVAPSLRGLGLEELGVLALESVVLFYGIEILLQARERRWDALRIAVLSALAVLAVKGLFL